VTKGKLGWQVTVHPVIVVHGPAAHEWYTHDDGTKVITADLRRGLLTQAAPEHTANDVAEIGKALTARDGPAAIRTSAPPERIMSTAFASAGRAGSMPASGAS
jgi:hypothetical protein